MPIERIAILETKVDAQSTRIDEIAKNVQSIRDVVIAGRGAGRLALWLTPIVGAALAAVIAAKWRAILMWIGS